jgi:hypothetical protein
VCFGVLVCAVYRSVMSPKDSSFAYLRLGGDELGAMLLWVALAFFSFIMNYIFGLSFVVLFALAGPWAAPLTGPLAGLVTLLVLAVLAVRFSLAGPVALVEGRQSLAGSWEISKKRFWSLLGMWAIVAVVSLLTYLLFSFLLGLLMLAMRTVAGFSNSQEPLLAMVVTMALTAVVLAFQAVLWAAPAAAAYVILTRRQEAPVEVFD